MVQTGHDETLIRGPKHMSTFLHSSSTETRARPTRLIRVGVRPIRCSAKTFKTPGEVILGTPSHSSP